MLKKIFPYFATLGTALAIPTPPPVDYAHDVRPILAENCFYCHGQDATKRKAKLRLDTREGQLSHEVIIPHQPDDSDLITRIFSTLDDEQMPPANSHRALTLAQKALLKRWVAEGAPYTPHWAFTAITRPTPPTVRREKWVHNPIDRFVLARLESEQITPSPEAPRATLIRRVSLDLTGLPPTPTELENFLADKSPDAYERLVDRLLASPHYGERMALPWLDAARYADSNGYQQDGDTFQWIWRDWVVKALNTNQPFDQFTIEQLAGDLLPTPPPSNASQLPSIAITSSTAKVAPSPRNSVTSLSSTASIPPPPTGWASPSLALNATTTNLIRSPNAIITPCSPVLITSRKMASSMDPRPKSAPPLPCSISQPPNIKPNSPRSKQSSPR
jgi:hypothetical protein